MKSATVIAFLVALLVSLTMSSNGIARGSYWPSSWAHAGVHALATANAVNLLGNSGYEMAGEGHAYCYFTDRRAIHFKKARH